jgi:hypothetical protein
MHPKWTLPGLAVILLAAAVISAARAGKITVAVRTWLTIGIIFAVIGAYLWMMD